MTPAETVLAVVIGLAVYNVLYDLTKYVLRSVTEVRDRFAYDDGFKAGYESRADDADEYGAREYERGRQTGIRDTEAAFGQDPEGWTKAFRSDKEAQLAQNQTTWIPDPRD